MIQLYQTIEDRDNPDHIEGNGPFWCTDHNAWLGCGYYFWENYIKNAHWWGESRYGDNRYIICKSSYVIDPDTCFDLVSNYDHCNSLSLAIDKLKEKGLYKDQETTISRILEFLKEIKVFKYKAARINITNSRSVNHKYSSRAAVCRKSNLFYNLIPQIQVCFYDKSLIYAGGYTIIYPEEYVEGYLA